MKRFLKILICAALVCLAVPFAGCDDFGLDDGGNGGGAAIPQPSDIEIKDFDYGFIAAEDYVDGGGMTSADGSKRLELNVATTYYFICDFKVSALRDNGGENRFSVSVTFNNIDIMGGTIQEVNSRLTNQIIDRDPNSGNPRMEITVNYNVPNKADNVQSYVVNMRLLPIRTGQSIVSVKFGKEYGSFNINGSNGVSRNIEITLAPIATPVIAYDENNLFVYWPHVKNANYYEIFVDSANLYDGEGKQVILTVPDRTSEGDPLRINLGDYITGRHRVMIRACNTSMNYSKSEYSNEVNVNY